MENTSPENRQLVGPKDVFLHLLGIITLYASAIAFNTLIFQYVNYWFPETSRGAYYYQEGLAQAIRFALSVLIVVFPVYFFTTRTLRKMAEADPERKNFVIRKWLSYFTMFLAAGIAIGFLIALINTFLNGDFTVAFLLKALAVFFTAGSVFYYYRAVSRGEENRPMIIKYAYVVAVIVFAAIIAAFFVVGSPEEQRARREDNQRVSDLQNIQYQIGDFYRAKKALPSKLSDLNDSFRGVAIPKDPETGKDYEYNLKDADTFELCSNFETAFSPNSQYRGGEGMDMAYPSKMPYFGPYGETWEHGIGRTCFERTIDPDYFKEPVVR